MMSWPKNITKHHMTTTWVPKSIKNHQKWSKMIKKHQKTSQNITKHQSGRFWSNLIKVWSFLMFFDLFWCFLIVFDRFWSFLIIRKLPPNSFPPWQKRSLLITFDHFRSKSTKNDQKRSQNIKKHHKTSQNTKVIFFDRIWSSCDLLWCFLMFSDRFWSFVVVFDGLWSKVVVFDGRKTVREIVLKW